MLRKQLRRAALLTAAVLLCFFCMAPAACAVSSGEAGSQNSGAAIKGSEAFEDLAGSGKYLGSAYRDNYAFDTEELGFMDAMEKAGVYVSNVIMNIDTMLAYIGVQIFHTAIQLNIAEVAGTQLDAIQQSLKNSIFEPLYIVGFIGIAWALVRKLLYRNITGILAEFGKVVLIIMFVALLGKNTSDVLTAVSSVTRDLGLSVVMQINGKDVDGDTESFAAETVSVLWNDLVHQPWLNIEFGSSSYSEADAESILSKAPYSDERQEAVNSYIEGHAGSFAKNRSWSRLGTLLVYTMVMIVKLVVYIACSGVMLAFQLLAIFYALLGVVIMILAMFETFGGIHLITDWLKKMVETQVMILVTTMLMGILIWFGSLMSFLNGTLGWLAGMLLQTLIIVIVFVFRKQIFRSFQRMSRAPGSLPQKMLAGSVVGAAAFAYRDRQMDQIRKRNVQYQMGAMELQQSNLSLAEKRQELAEEQRETASLRNEMLRQDLEQREEARARREARRAAAAEKAERKKQDPQAAELPKASRPVTTAQKPAEPKTEQREAPEVQRPVTTEAAVGTPTQRGGSTEPETQQEIRYAKHLEDMDGLAGSPEQAVRERSPDYIQEQQLHRTPQTAAAPRPVTTNSVPQDERKAAESAVPRPNTTAPAREPVAAARPKTEKTAATAPQSRSEQRDTEQRNRPAERQNVSQTRSYSPVRPMKDRSAPESSVQRPEMRPEPEAPKAALETAVPRVEPSAKTPAAPKAQAAVPTQRQASRTHRDLAAERAERKQEQAGRSTAAGTMHYDRNAKPDAPQGVERPEMKPEETQEPKRTEITKQEENKTT